MTTEIKEATKHAIPKLCTDIVAGIAVILLLTILWWLRLYPIKVSFSTFPLQGVIFFIDLPLGIIGAIWLEYTHREFLRNKFPVYYRWHLKGILFFFCLFLPLVLLKYGK